MNKQLTKKSIAIAASAALMASVALSGSALAAPGGKKGPPPADTVYCNLADKDTDGNYVVTHACADTLRYVSSVISGAMSVIDRDKNSLLNKVCEAHYKFEADKLHDASYKLTDIKETILKKRKVSEDDQGAISLAAEEAAQAVLASCP
jgi:hypothetical protein